MADYDHDSDNSSYGNQSNDKPLPPRDNSHPLSPRDNDAKNHALFAYIMMGLGYFTGICWVIGGAWAMVKINDFRGTEFEDHFANIIKVFWWGLGLTVIGYVTVFIFIGWFILLGVFVWSVFRLVKGIANLTTNRPYNY